MCPEFLREGSGVDDFFDPPFTVIGADDAESAPRSRSCSRTSMLAVASSDATAEALKYACNAFHATKVSFANEIARLFRRMDVDSRE